MYQLFIINFAVIAAIVIALIILKKKIKTEKGKYWLLLVSSILTIVCHYSSLIYHLIVDGTCIDFLMDNPNLVLPIYPCNCVMWCCLILGIIKKKDSKLGSYLIDYIFFFGAVAGVIGLFANIDFFKNPTLANYDVTKCVFSHGFMLFNTLLLPVFGFVRIDFKKNIIHTAIFVLMMLVIGAYCSLLITVIDDYSAAYNYNSMFLLHSPFDGLPFLVYPFIAAVAFVLYIGVYYLCSYVSRKINTSKNKIEEVENGE